MAPTIKQLLSMYKEVNHEFRTEYDGELWTCWLDRTEDYHPTWLHYTNEQLIKALTERLKQAAHDKQLEALRANTFAERIEKALRGEGCV